MGFILNWRSRGESRKRERRSVPKGPSPPASLHCIGKLSRSHFPVRRMCWPESVSFSPCVDAGVRSETCLTPRGSSTYHIVEARDQPLTTVMNNCRWWLLSLVGPLAWPINRSVLPVEPRSTGVSSEFEESIVGSGPPVERWAKPVPCTETGRLSALDPLIAWKMVVGPRAEPTGRKLAAKDRRFGDRRQGKMWVGSGENARGSKSLASYYTSIRKSALEQAQFGCEAA